MDWPLVQAVLEYRLAARGKEIWEGPTKEIGERLKKEPGAMEMLAKMRRAQAGLPLDASSEDLRAEGLVVAQTQAPGPDDDEEETP